MSKIVLILAVVTASIFSLAWVHPDEVDLVKVGDKVPVFKLKAGQSEITAESLKGKVVLINFFATWCPPCVKELPHLEKDVWMPHKDDDDFVLLVVGREHTQDEVDRFAAKRGLNLPFYSDSQREMFSLFAKQNIPRNYIIDRQGKIIYSAVGFNEVDFEKMKELLKEQLD